MVSLQSQSLQPCSAPLVFSLLCSNQIDRVGQENSPAVVKKMLSTLTSPLEFPAFLTYISSLTSQLSSRDQLHAAFGSFDDSDSGLIDFKDLKNDLMTMGSMRMTEQQVDMALGDFVENTGKNVKVVYERLLDSMVGQRVAQV